MSWSAETFRKEVNKSIIERRPQFKLWCLSDKLTDSLPSISECIGENLFLKYASKNKLTTPVLNLSSWMGIAILLLALSTFIGIRGSEIFLKGLSQNLSDLASNPMFYGITAILFLLVLISRKIGTIITTQTKSKSIEKFLEQTIKSSSTTEKHNHANFIEDLAYQLSRKYLPRIVIIDNYDRLDYITKDVIECYFKKYSEYSEGFDFWCIFESQADKSFSRIALTQRQGAYSKTRFFQQLLLTKTQRLELAKHINISERAEFTFVKYICNEQNETEQDRIIKILKEYREKHPKNPHKFAELEFLYLLSLNNLFSSSTKEFKDFSEGLLIPVDSDFYLSGNFYVKGLSTPNVLRNEVLKQFLPGIHSIPKEFRDCLEKIEKQFGSMLALQESSQKLFRIIPELTIVLLKNAQQLQLPDPQLGHLFWSLFWYDKLQNQPIDASWVRKLIYHVLEANVISIHNEQVYEGRITFGRSKLPSVLHQKIIEFLTSLPNIHESSMQRVLIYNAELPPQLQNQIGIGTPPTQFVQLLISTLNDYGKLEDGRYALETILESAKQYLGQDRKAYCDTLIQDLQALPSLEEYQPQKRIPQFPSQQSYVTFYEKILPQFFEVLMFTIEGALQCCVFGDVFRLLRKSFYLLEEEILQAVSYKKRLLKKCWEVFLAI